MNARSERLQAYIDDTPLRPTIGVDDCGPWVARWVSRETGRQVAFPRYSTREEGYAIAEQAGGLKALADEVLSFLRPRWTNPELGDVAVIALSDRDTAAIVCAGGIMAIRGERQGVYFLKPRADHIKGIWGLDGR